MLILIYHLGNKRKIRKNKKSNKLEGEIDNGKKTFAKKFKPSEEDPISLSDHDNDEKSNYFIEFSRGYFSFISIVNQSFLDV